MLSTDGWGDQSDWSRLDCCQVLRKIVGISFMHDFHSESSAVEHVGPGVQNSSLSVDDRLVEVEAVEVEGHGANAEGGEPDADYRPGCEEEVQAAAVVE